MVYRVYVEKKRNLANEAKALTRDIREFLGISNLKTVRIVNRYDVENIDKELFEYSKKTVFSEPQLDVVTDTLNLNSDYVFAVEYLPGQYDQRADSAAQCIQIISQGERPAVRTARIYMLEGTLSEDDISRIKKYLINPVESCEATLEEFETLAVEFTVPEEVDVIEGFRDMKADGLEKLISQYGLAMDIEDIKCCKKYFCNEKRDPTITEIKMIDTYWSDHCRHTTFNTTIDSVEFEDELLEKSYNEYLAARNAVGRKKPINLMDVGTIAARYLKAIGKLDKLDESDEINACTVKIKVNADGKAEDWLLLFKNETHNHPTEIEPFGGAATCIGGAIRDPLSGRSYVYAAMRVTGAADPLRPIEETIPGKLPQRKIVTTAAAGYSSYGNQIGIATGQVDELYHDGYAAKRMEVGAVIAAAPAGNVRREHPAEGDVIILLGGRTGRDGIGGATGSSKAHTKSSLETCGAEVQKGNAPEERKLQRLFRNPEASQLIKCCNDFGAGGVSVAIGELADGLEIDLNKVPKKYEGLDGTELAISESQERMAVVVDKNEADHFCRLAEDENLEATIVAKVTKKARLVMNWNGKKIVDISREFLNSNGAEKHINIAPAAYENIDKPPVSEFTEGYEALAADLNVCSKRGLSERFDSTIGAGTVIMPFGGKNQLTPSQAMVHKISIEDKDTTTCSLMAWGYNPYIAVKSPFHSAYLAVVESISKLIASGSKFEDIYLSFQEFFEKPNEDPIRWGKPLAALLGAFKAQIGLGVAAIGGKDSMSGTFENIDVPPTLISFAVTTEEIKNIISPEFKNSGHKVVILRPTYGECGLPQSASMKKNFETVSEFIRNGKICSAYTPTYGGVAEGIMKMAFGNNIGFEFDSHVSLNDIFAYSYGSFILELNEDADIGETLGKTNDTGFISYKNETADLKKLLSIYENRLEPVYPCNIGGSESELREFTYNIDKYHVPSVKSSKPKAVIPVFPGTNCEYDTAKAMRTAGIEPEIIVVNNLTSEGVSRSVERFAERIKEAQIIFIPGGFSGGDEPDGSGKFITAFFRNAEVKDSVTELLDKRDGLMCGICNGFQALIKLGLVPYGKIIDTDENCPTLTFNTIGRHQSRIVYTRIASNKSPWLAETKPGEVYAVPISHGEGRFFADEEFILRLAENGQIATQYVDFTGKATYDVRFNPNNSVYAIEGITSPDGRILGKMGHSERVGNGLYKNVPGQYEMGLFKSAVKYFK